MKALIVVDVQNDFVTGSLGSFEAQSIIPAVKDLIETYQKNGDAIYYTQDTHTHDEYLKSQEGVKLPVEHCIWGTWGWRIVDGCDIKGTYNNVYHYHKDKFGYDYWEDCNLSNCEEITICGLVSSICVVTNALLIKTAFPEVPIKFAAYASAGLSSDNHAAAIEVMRSCQIEVIE